MLIRPYDFSLNEFFVIVTKAIVLYHFYIFLIKMKVIDK